MTSTNEIDIQPTADEIDAAILAAISDGDVHCWGDIAPGIPGGFQQRMEAVVRLRLSGRIDAVEHRGRTFIAEPLPLRSIIGYMLRDYFGGAAA